MQIKQFITIITITTTGAATPATSVAAAAMTSLTTSIIAFTNGVPYLISVDINLNLFVFNRCLLGKS